MSTLDHATTELSSYLEEWLDANPDARLIRVFLPAARAPAYAAHACLEHALLQAATQVRERETAQLKLAWWHDELQRACEGSARHPVTRSLSGFGVLIPARRAAANELVSAANLIAAGESPADTGELVAPYAAFAGASHALRIGTPPHDEAENAMGATLLVGALRHWPCFAAPQRARVPLSLLARAGATRDGLARGESGAAVVLGALAAALQPMLSPDAADPVAGARIIAAAHTVRAIRRDPQACVLRPPSVRTLPLLVDLWRHARRVAVAAAPC